MKVRSVTRRSSSLSALEIEASASDYIAEENRIYQRLRKKAKVPGFRPGKAPREILRARYGKAVESEAVEACVGEALEEALKEQGLVPLTDPTVRDVERTPEGGVVFHVDVEALPEFDVPDYGRLEVVREVEEVSQERVEERLDQFRRMVAQVKAVDRPARPGDLVRFQYQRVDPSGVPLVGTTVDDNSLVVGEREDLKPFWEAVLGAKAGESRDFAISAQPSGLGSSAREERRQEQRYRVTLKEVCERELPSLDDEFAKDVGEFTSLQELREHTRARLEKEAEELATRAAEDELLRRVVEKGGVEPVPSLVERYLSSLVEEARQAHQARGDERPFDETHLREAHRAEAASHVAEYLVIRRIAEKEGLEPSEEEVRSYAVSLSGREPADDELSSLRGRLREKSVREFLMERAKVKERRRKALPAKGKVVRP